MHETDRSGYTFSLVSGHSVKVGPESRDPGTRNPRTRARDPLKV